MADQNETNIASSHRMSWLQKNRVGGGREALRFILISIGLAYLLVGLLAFSLWALTLSSRQVRAHEAPSGWRYPPECCSNRDCAPIHSWVHDPHTGLITITTKFGTASMSADEIDRIKRPSGDGNTHACILGGNIVCVFIPNVI